MTKGKDTTYKKIAVPLVKQRIKSYTIFKYIKLTGCE